MAKILVVDDNPTLVKEIRAFLEDEEHTVVTAANGEEGLKKIQKEKPDLMVLDVMMPGKDGFQVSREVRKDPNIRETPILMLTGIKEDMGLDFKQDAGDPDWLPVNDYCDKPIDPDTLIEKVNQLLQKKQG